MSQTHDTGFDVTVEVEPSGSPVHSQVFGNPTYDSENLTDDSLSYFTGPPTGMLQQPVVPPGTVSPRELGFIPHMPVSRPVISPLFGIPRNATRRPSYSSGQRFAAPVPPLSSVQMNVSSLMANVPHSGIMHMSGNVNSGPVTAPSGSTVVHVPLATGGTIPISLPISTIVQSLPPTVLSTSGTQGTPQQTAQSVAPASVPPPPPPGGGPPYSGPPGSGPPGGGPPGGGG